jgi:hypothetical protein
MFDYYVIRDDGKRVKLSMLKVDDKANEDCIKEDCINELNKSFVVNFD